MAHTGRSRACGRIGCCPHLLGGMAGSYVHHTVFQPGDPAHWAGLRQPGHVADGGTNVFGSRLRGDTVVNVSPVEQGKTDDVVRPVPLTVTGVIVWPSHDVWAFLSDGSKATSFSGRLSFAAAGFCIIGGKRVERVDHADAGDYVYDPPPFRPVPSFASIQKPVNQADVTYIGNYYKQRSARPVSTGLLHSDRFQNTSGF